MRARKHILFSAILVSASIWTLAAARADEESAASFYKGKTVAFLIGAQAGGGTDIAGRLAARHLGKYVPGQPTVVAQNMQGAGSLKLTNYLANVAKRDGLSLGLLVRGVVQLPILGDRAAKFDPLELTWIGTMSSAREDAYLLVINKSRGISSVADLRNAPSPVTLGASGGNSTNRVFAKLSSELFKFNTRLIEGYRGTADVMLAVRRGEVDGIYSTLMTLSKEDMFKSGGYIPIVQAGRSSRHPDFKNVPLVRELVTDPADKSLLNFIESLFEISLPIAAPPSIPTDRAKALQDAFMKMNTDSQYVTEAKKLELDVSPLDGHKVREIIYEMAQTPATVLKRYQDLVQR